MDFLPAAAMSAEDLEKQRQVAEELAKRTRWVDFEYDGQPAQVRFQDDTNYIIQRGLVRCMLAV